MKNKQAMPNLVNGVFCVLLCIMVSAVWLVGCTAQEEVAGTNTTATAEETTVSTTAAAESNEDTTADATLATEPDEEYEGYTTLPPIEVEMDMYTFSYSGEWSSVIFIEKTDNDVAFFTELNNQRIPIFTLVYNSQEGDIVTVLTLGDGERIPVAFQMFSVPEGLSQVDAHSFITAQEAVNDVMSSIKAK